jgi:hypothetical protein
MSRFNAILHRTGERLALPRATRGLILVEIASDLEDLFQHYVQQGMSEEEAARHAEDKVDMSDQALAELVRIHSDMRGWTDRMGRRVQPFWERFAMALIVVFFAAAASLGIDTRTLAHATGFVWPIAAIFAALIVFFIVQLTRFGNNPDHRRLRRSLATPLFLGAASLVVGLTGTGIVLYRTFMHMAATPDRAGTLFASAALSTTATFAIAMLVTLCAGVVWFVLAGKVSRLEDEAARSVLEVG